MSGAIGRLFRRAVYLREGETTALLWSCAFFFFILSSYYVIRPIRDEMGVAGGVQNLAYLFTGTLIGVLLVHPLYTALVAHLPRRRFVPYTYRFFILNLIIFFLLFRAAEGTQSVWIGRVFFIWVSVLNLFIVSVFWSFMTDIYRTSQSKRLFGVVAVGGTLGAMLGSTITTLLVGLLGPINLLLVSAVLLELAARASQALEKHEARLALAALEDEKEERRELAVAGTGGVAVTGKAGLDPDAAADEAGARSDAVIGGGVFEGVQRVLRSPYLLGIAALVALFAIASTFLYFQVAAIVARVFEDDPVGRTRLFAGRDLAVNTPDARDADLPHRPGAALAGRRLCPGLSAGREPVRVRGPCRGARPHRCDRFRGAPPVRKLRHPAPGPRGPLHGPAQDRQVQGKELQRHLRLPGRGPGGRLVLHCNGMGRDGALRLGFCHGPCFGGLACPGFLGREEKPGDPPEPIGSRAPRSRSGDREGLAWRNRLGAQHNRQNEPRCHLKEATAMAT